ncbi:hypothetical protein ACTGJ9_018365 [Bradyrhizobium sp. RDM12]
MIIYTVDAKIKAALVASLTAHGTDRLVLAGLGRVSRENSAAATASIIAVWPAEPEGSYRIALSDVAGYIVWRAYICAEIGAGRGRREDIAKYQAALGVQTKAAYSYVAAIAKGSSMRPCCGSAWSDNTRWVVCSGDAEEPRRRWARSAWAARARAHRILTEFGLSLPRQSTWRPIATALFDEPVCVVPLAPEDDAALSLLA